MFPDYRSVSYDYGFMYSFLSNQGEIIKFRFYGFYGRLYLKIYFCVSVIVWLWSLSNRTKSVVLFIYLCDSNGILTHNHLVRNDNNEHDNSMQLFVYII